MVTKAAEFKDSNYKLDGCASRLQEYGSKLDGTVMTPHGLVGAYTFSFPGMKGWAGLDFIHNGRLYHRHYYQSFSRIGLARKAHLFAKEVVGA